MESEFNLSDKIEGQMKTIGQSIPLEDVKLKLNDFLQELKDESVIRYRDGEEFNKTINELALKHFGRDLLGGRKNEN